MLNKHLQNYSRNYSGLHWVTCFSRCKGKFTVQALLMKEKTAANGQTVRAHT